MTIGDMLTVETARGSVRLRVVGLARTAGSAENQGGVALTRGSRGADDLLRLVGPFASPGPFDKTSR